MANQEGSFVGRYGDTLRRLTALEAQKSGGALAPQQVGGADTGGFGPTLQVQPTAVPSAGAFSAPAQPTPAEPGMGQPQPATAPATTPSGFGTPSEYPPVLNDVPGVAGPLGGQAGPGPIEMGGDKPTSFGDLTANADDDQKEELAAQVEKQAGPGGLKDAFGRIKAVLGAKTPETKMARHDMALYVAEVALRAMSKRSDPAYAQNPDGVFADAVLETQAARDQTTEKRRLEGREDSQTTHREAREDTVHTRTRGEQSEDHVRDRGEKVEDDERNHKQALELARVQAKLLREKGQRTSIQVGDDGTLKLIDLETGEAVTVTEEGEETTSRGSRGKGTVTTTKKVRKPVRASPKYNAGGLDADTRLNRITETEKALRGDNKFMRDLRTKFKNDTVKIEAEISRMAEEKVDNHVQSMGGAAASGAKTTKFADMK